MEKAFHYLARGVFIALDHVLLARQIGAQHTFLPGGHIEFGEPAMEALVREMAEETGLTARVEHFLGAVEAVFEDGGRVNAEIDLVFRATLADSEGIAPVPSRESQLEFIWAGMSELDAHNLLPQPMRELIRNARPDGAAFFGSSVEQFPESWRPVPEALRGGG